MTDSLRSRAEALLSTNPVATPAVSTVDAQRLIHELQVYQVELEMQNEELRRAQLELAQSRDAYVELYDFAPVGYLTLDADGAILETNYTAAQMLGVERSNLVRRKFAGFVDRGAQDPWFRHHRTTLTRDEKQTINLPLHRADGEPFTARLECRPQPAASPADRRCLVALIDITSQQQAEDAMQRTHDDLEDLIANRTQALQDSRVELRKLASELSLAADRERRRIATALHDELGQLLTTCRFRIDLVHAGQGPEPADENLNWVALILDQAIEATRAMTFALSCPMLDELGLAPALEQLCADLARESKVKIEFRGDSQPLPPLGEEKRLVLYRATRELLVNVLKYAEAEQVQVGLESTARKVRIRVEDDGRGFDASRAGAGFSPSGGFGLFNTREDMQHFGGALCIDSLSNQGTRATLDMPADEHTEPIKAGAPVASAGETS